MIAPLRKGLLVTAVALFQACASIRPLNSEEAQVITTALSADWSWAGITPGRDLLIASRTYFWEGQRLDPGFFQPYDRSGSNINFTVPMELLSLLPGTNRADALVGAELLPPRVQRLAERDTKNSYISVSRPAVALDRAVVAVGFWPPSIAPEGSCTSGFLIYLEHRGGKWAVVGYGGPWIT